MTQSSTTPDPIRHDAAENIDPVTGLYRMSRTAGVGLQDYAEINPFAVGSLVAGLASWLVFFGQLLFIVPLLGLIMGLWAVIRILGSNRTQTGLLPAFAGIALSAGVGGYGLYERLVIARFDAADQAAIVKLVDDLAASILAGNPGQAWDLFDPRFQARISREQFVERLNTLQASAMYGQISEMRWNGLIDFERSPDSDDRMAGSLLLVTVKAPDSPASALDRQRIAFVRPGGGEWRILNLPGYFPAENRVDNSGMPPPPGGG